ncbi:hypothetical protein Tco_1277503, partial [Tanacetum coccineum]
MEEKEVSLVDGVFEGALGALEDEEDDEVVICIWMEFIERDLVENGMIRVNTLKLKKLMNFFRSRKIGMIWSFSVLGVCKSTKIPFICEDCLAIE